MDIQRLMCRGSGVKYTDIVSKDCLFRLMIRLFASMTSEDSKFKTGIEDTKLDMIKNVHQHRNKSINRMTIPRCMMTVDISHDKDMAKNKKRIWYVIKDQDRSEAKKHTEIGKKS
ncbi:unnamed protein product [Euphydryas editha]|uniref:Uncharacterized protein n=1 Tax=Euphydryas editha TaxID=104508 RepID=A0AAU9TTV6_EUPED|nr:unnamed protein product [Euphydryas editha]